MKKVAIDCWCELPQHFKNIELDEYIVMPNHVHGIIIIRFHEGFNKAKFRFDKSGFDKSNPYIIHNNPMMQPQVTLGGVVRHYKAKSAYLIRNSHGFDYFDWQSRYYDRIIWGKSDLERVRSYIRRHNSIK
jgi:REP element-mobilizing transposase RayT